MTIYITCIACTGITAYGETGYGHQMKDQLTAIIIAKIFNYQYANTFHKPLTVMGLHNNCLSVNDLPSNIHKEYIERMGVINGMSFKQLYNLNIRFQSISKDKDLLVIVKKQSRVLLHQIYEWSLLNKVPVTIFYDVRKCLYNMFTHQNSNIPIYLSKQCRNIAMHIRRGDTADPKLKKLGVMGIQKDDNPFIMHSNLPVHWYHNISQKIIQEDNLENNYHIHVFTEKKHSQDVSDFFKNNNKTTLHIGESIESDILNMCHCDYIIMSNSGLSTLIGYMSTNSKKYYHPNPHSPDSLPSPEYNPVLLDN
jgi:hypothetical protein